MNNLKRLTFLLPSGATTIGLTILPIFLTLYVFIAQSTDRLVIEQNATYQDVQTGMLSKLYINQNVIDAFNRFMDFAIWGFIAILVVVLVWLFDHARVSLKNHYAVESFKNFNQNKASWHGHFLVVALLKVALLCVIVTSIIFIVAEQVPKLTFYVSSLLMGFEVNTALSALYIATLIFFLQYAVVCCINVFKHTRAM